MMTTTRRMKGAVGENKKKKTSPSLIQCLPQRSRYIWISLDSLTTNLLYARQTLCNLIFSSRYSLFCLYRSMTQIAISVWLTLICRQWTMMPTNFLSVIFPPFLSCHLFTAAVGKLSKSTILNGFSALKVMSNPDPPNIYSALFTICRGLQRLFRILMVTLLRNLEACVLLVNNSPIHTIRAQ